CTRAPHTPACGSGAAWRREWRGQSRFFEFSRLPGATKGRSSQLRAAAAAAAPGRDDVHDLVLHVDPEVQLHLGLRQQQAADLSPAADDVHGRKLGRIREKLLGVGELFLEEVLMVTVRSPPRIDALDLASSSAG